MLSASLRNRRAIRAFDPSSGHLRKTVRQLDEPLRQAQEQTADQRRMLLQQREKRRARREQTDRLFERDRRGGKRPTLVGRDRAEGIARAEDLENDVLARRRHLHDLHAPTHHNRKELGRVSLGED